jgi:cell wall-associated NlpC family hydrolase
MLTGLLLDDGGRRLAQALAALAIGVVALLFAAVFIPVVVLVSVLPSPIASSAPPAEGSPPLPAARAMGQPSFSVPLATGIGPAEVARRYLGVRYVFGGTDPTVGLDCSALVQLVFRQLGVSLPRTAQRQYEATLRIPRDQLQAGDLVFFARTYQDPNDWITHVGIYIGDGQQINAPVEGQVVSVQPVFTGFWGAHFAAGGRVGRP